MLKNEIKLQRKLRHQSLSKLNEVFESKKAFYLVFEYFSEKNLL